MRTYRLRGALALCAAAALIAARAGADVTLTGDTSRPAYSLFPLGEPVKLTFAADGMRPDEADLTLDLAIVDEHDAKVQNQTLPVRADAGGRWQTTVAAPSGRLGFYRVRARLSNGVQLQPLGSRPAGFLTYAIVPDPAKRVDYPEDRSRFGMQGAPGEGDTCALMGVRWVLEGALYWERAEPDRSGQFGPEQIARYARDRNPGTPGHHVYTLAPLFMAPNWAVIPATHIYETGTLTPDGEKAWAAYCAAAARAYSARNPGVRSHIYQITWEPVPPWGFKGTDRDLIRIYEIAYKALHDADSRAVVAGPCRGIWNNGDPQDTERLFKLGLGKYLDAYLSHPYDTITPERDGMPQAIRTIRTMLQATTGRDMPMYGAEQGWPTDEDVSKEVLQAQGLLRQNLITLGEGYKFNFAFTFYDYRMEGSRTGYGYCYNLVNGVPFGPNKTCPKPIAAAWAAQSFLLEGCDSAGAIEWLGDNVLGYTFQRPDGYRALALWCYGEKPRTVSVPTGASQVRVYDWMGRERVARTAAGSLSLTLGPEPTYVTGVSPTLWGTAAARYLSLASASTAVFPGRTAAIQGVALAPGRTPFRGTLALETERAWGMKPTSVAVTLRPGARTPFRLRLPIPARLPAGAYTPRLVLRDAAGTTVAATGVTLRVTAPVTVRVEPVFGMGHRPGLALTLANQQAEAAAGTASVALKELLPGAARAEVPMIDLVQDPGKAVAVAGGSGAAKFALPGRGVRRLVVPLPAASLSAARRYQAVVRLSNSQGWDALQTAPVNFLPARHLAAPPTVDADLSDWPAAPAAELAAPRDVIRNPQLCPKELSARLRYAWDERALYVAADVSDDRFLQPFSGDLIWRGDCIQMAFNLDAAVPNSSTSANARRTSEITVALTPQGPQAYRHLSYAAEKLPLGPLTPEQIRLAVRQIGAGRLVYEMAIPWTTLGLAPGRPMAAGGRIGVGATVNEMRTPDQRDPCALGLFGGIYPDKDPEKLGVLVLGR